MTTSERRQAERYALKAISDASKLLDGARQAIKNGEFAKAFDRLECVQHEAFDAKQNALEAGGITSFAREAS